MAGAFRKTTPARDGAGEDLLLRAMQGDGRAWAALVESYGALVHGTAIRAGLGHADAEEVSQLVWMALLRGGRSIRAARSLPGWLAVTAHRTALRVLRRRVPVLSTTERLTSEEPSAEELLLREERIDTMRRALAKLSPRCRALLTALYADERPDYRGVAQRLGLPLGSIGPSRARCLVRLRDLLAGEEPDPARRPRP
jgi:RNA polymerase sigma factor (sigma-70 family)